MLPLLHKRLLDSGAAVRPSVPWMTHCALKARFGAPATSGKVHQCHLLVHLTRDLDIAFVFQIDQCSLVVFLDPRKQTNKLFWRGLADIALDF